MPRVTTRNTFWIERIDKYYGFGTEIPEDLWCEEWVNFLRLCRLLRFGGRREIRVDRYCHLPKDWSRRLGQAIRTRKKPIWDLDFDMAMLVPNEEARSYREMPDFTKGDAEDWWEYCRENHFISSFTARDSNYAVLDAEENPAALAPSDYWSVSSRIGLQPQLGTYDPG